VPLDEHGLPRWKRLQQDGASTADADFLRRRGRLAVAWPLLGTDSVLPGGDAGEFYRRVLDDEKVSLLDFRVTAATELASRGSWRTLHVMPGDMCVEHEPDEKGGLRLEFFLPRGSYATVVLREYMKSGPQSMC